MKSDKLLVVLDLDETLIHATRTPLVQPADFQIFGFHVYKRPGVDAFLENLLNAFNVAIWSSAGEQYVEGIVTQLRDSEDFQFIWGKKKCTQRRNVDLDKFVQEKRLAKLKPFGFSLKRMLVVDDSPEKCIRNFGNAIYIAPFTGNQDDQELIHLEKYLLTFSVTEDVRKIEKRHWRKETPYGNRQNKSLA